MTIKRLRLKNFRLHEDNEINFEDSSQLVLLAGTNGSGKSSVLEAIHYAIWSEGRTPKTRLDSMVRGGCELEGMTVELELEHNGHEFIVTRHYEDGMSHATLTMDGTTVTQGPREVTRYFSQLFGMDVRGFDLAVFAPQKQLNGLTSLSAAKRAQTVSRLVRADVFTRARDDARSAMNDTKRLLQNLGDLPEITDLEAARDARQEELDAAVAAQEEASAEASRLEEELRTRSDVQEQHRKAQSKRSHADGQRAAAQSALESAERDLEAAVASLTDRPDLPEGDLEDLEDELDEIGTRLSAAREAESADHDREVLNGEIESLTKQRDDLQTKIGDFRDNVESTSAVVKAEQALKGRRHELEDITSTGQDVNSQLAVAKNQVASSREAIDRLSGLDAVCPTCEQGIPDEHRDKQVQEAEARLAAVEKEAADFEQQLRKLSDDRAAKITEVKEHEKALEAARSREAEVAADEQQLSQLERTLSLYQRRIDALPAPGEPVAPLAEKRASVAAQVQALRNAERALRDWERKENTRSAAETTVSRAKITLEKAEAAFAESEIPQDLADAVDELGVIAAKMAAERDLAAECTTLAAVAEQQLNAANSTLTNAQDEANRRAKLVTDVEYAEAASRLLTASATHMTNRIRPSLEGAVGSLLSVMSEGRYDTVKIDKDYNIKVKVDTGFRPLLEMSGGEQDLVALALRLGLSRIVSSTHGSSGPGFLVLDEVFGSQDVRRREMIVDALKSLRGIFPQILLVSHVDGAEDQVDQLVRFELIEGDDQAGTTDSSLVTVE